MTTVRKRTKKEPDVIDIKTIVPTLPEGTHYNVCISIPYSMRTGSYYSRFALMDGKVYTLNRDSIDLAAEGRMGINDAVRRNYCSLAGIKFKELMAVVKQKRAAEKNQAESREFRRMERTATKMGYRLVKVNR